LMKKLSSVLICACVCSNTAAPVWVASVPRPQLHCICLWDKTSRLAMYAFYILKICPIHFCFKTVGLEVFIVV
jgi:hypothetical protein